jgi:hypothetical protein
MIAFSFGLNSYWGTWGAAEIEESERPEAVDVVCGFSPVGAMDVYLLGGRIRTV